METCHFVSGDMIKCSAEEGNKDNAKGLGTHPCNSTLFFWRSGFDLLKETTALFLHPFISSRQHLLEDACHKHLGICISCLALWLLPTKGTMCFPDSYDVILRLTLGSFLFFINSNSSRFETQDLCPHDRLSTNGNVVSLSCFIL